MTKKKRTAARRGNVYGGSEAGSPPPTTSHRNALRGFLAEGRHRCRLPSLAVVWQQVTELGIPVGRDRVRDVLPSFGASDGRFALRFSETSGRPPPRPEMRGVVR